MTQRIHASFARPHSWIDQMILDSEDVVSESTKKTLSMSQTALIQRAIVRKFLSQTCYAILCHTEDPEGYETRKGDSHYKNIKEFIGYAFSKIFYHPICTVVGVIYFEKLKTQTDLDIDFYNYRIYLAICIMLGSKMYEDSYCSNKTYLSDFNSIDLFDDNEIIDLSEWNRYEAQVLTLLDFDLFVKYDEVKTFIEKYYEWLSDSVKKGISADHFKHQLPSKK
eukprot:gene7336-11655_t